MRYSCPICGTLRVEVGYVEGRCLEDDCGHVGPARDFRGLSGRKVWSPNVSWRDPVALLPGGYEDNG